MHVHYLPTVFRKQNLQLNDVLLRAGVGVKLVSAKNELEVKGAHGIKVVAAIEKMNTKDFDILILPVGPGSFSLKDDENILDFV